MALHVTLLTPSTHTPTYLLTCGRSLHRTVIDPTDATAVTEALGKQQLDLILLTSATPATLAAARQLHLHTGAPVLSGATTATAARGAHLPVARRLMDGDIVGLGPLAQTLALPAPLPEEPAEGQPPAPVQEDIMAYAIGSSGLLFVGGLFTPEQQRTELPATLRGLPGGWQVFGGHAPDATEATAPTLASLL